MFAPRRVIAASPSLLVALLLTLQPMVLEGKGKKTPDSWLLTPALAALAPGEQAPLTNDDIIMMVQAKLADAVISAKIKSSTCKFDTSPSALIKLKQAGVSSGVMEAMTEAGMATVGTPSAPPPDPDDPRAEHDPGIYYTNPSEHRLTQLEPTAYSGGKATGMFTSLITYGLSKTKLKAVVLGEKSSTRASGPRPTFYFYFEQKEGTLSNAAQWAAWFGGLSTPNQFTLVRLQRKKNDRELAVGALGILGSSTGTRGKDVVEFDYTKVSPGIYKVVPRRDMRFGEYCFFYTGQNTAPGAGGGSLFDFGIDPPQ